MNPTQFLIFLGLGVAIVALLFAIWRRLITISAQITAYNTYSLMIEVVTKLESVEERLVNLRTAIDQVEATTSRLLPDKRR